MRLCTNATESNFKQCDIYAQNIQAIPGDWNNPGGHCTQPSNDRRMSEPIRSNQAQRISPPIPPRPRSAQLPELQPELHPNQEVILDEMGEGEMVENKLVIPDEMMQYLNQVIMLAYSFSIQIHIISLTLISFNVKIIALYRFKRVEIKVIAAVLCLFVNRRYARIFCIINDRCNPRVITINHINKTVIPLSKSHSNLVRTIRILLPHLMANVRAHVRLSLRRSIVRHRITDPRLLVAK